MMSSQSTKKPCDFIVKRTVPLLNYKRADYKKKKKKTIVNVIHNSLSFSNDGGY